MFGLNENTQYYVCQRYVRMNMGINGLYQIVKTEMELPPLGGAVFIFFSKNRQQVKMLLKEEWLVFVVMGLGVLDERGLDCLSFLCDVDGYAGIWQGCCSLSLVVGMRPFLFFYYYYCFLG